MKTAETETAERYVDLMSDIGFKLVFGREANKDILIAFLNEVIPDRHIINIEFLDKEKHGTDRNAKECIFDVYCKTDDGSFILVEVQNKKQEHYIERSLYYSVFPVQEQLERGDREYDISGVFIINILAFSIANDHICKDVMSHYRLMNIRNGKMLTDKFNVIYIELENFTKGLDELDGSILDGFYFCLKNICRLKSHPKELRQTIFTRLFDAAGFAGMNSIEQRKYINAMNTDRDIRNQIAYAAKEGKRQSALEIAQKLLDMGISPEQVRIATGVSADDIVRD